MAWPAAHMKLPDSPGRDRRTTGILLSILGAAGLALPGVASSAGPCGWVAGVSRWTGDLSFLYAASYVDPTDGTQLDIRHGADTGFELTPFSQGPGGITWEGLATGTGRVADKATEQDPPDVTTVDGAGNLLPTVLGSERSRVTLNVNL